MPNICSSRLFGSKYRRSAPSPRVLRRPTYGLRLQSASGLPPRLMVADPLQNVQSAAAGPKVDFCTFYSAFVTI
jgi:hypothetical protein